MSEPLAIIAGAGAFPRHAAAEAKRRGRRVVALALRGWADDGLAQYVDAIESIDIGQLGHLISRLKALGAREAIMAGKVTKSVLLDPSVQFDAEAVGVLGGVTDYSVNSVLGAIGRRLAKDGITLLDSSTFLKDGLCPVGVLTKAQPTPAQQRDIRLGMDLARQMAAWDVGQTVVIKNQVVVAVEALEGTDAAIRRAGEVGGAEAVVVKMASPTQDMRFDLPVLGLQTIAVAEQAGVRCLAVEARKTLLLDREALIGRADAIGLCLVGVEPSAERAA